MKTNKKGIDLIKKFEGCKIKVYLCPTGHKTVGYGHMDDKMKLGKEYTIEEIDKLFDSDIAKCEKALNKYQAKYNFNENQYSALISFIFNLGTSSIDQLTANGTRSIQTIYEKMALYNKGVIDGKMQSISGLVNRRKAERELFNQEVFEKSTKTCVVIAKSGLNLRNNPSMNGRVITAVPFNYTLELVEVVNSDWVKVKYKTKTLYCSRKWVKM